MLTLAELVHTSTELSTNLPIPENMRFNTLAHNHAHMCTHQHINVHSVVHASTLVHCVKQDVYTHI